MGVVSQVMAAAPTAAPTGISQCKPATATTITLCWTKSTIAAVNIGNNIKSYYITNATETCTGSGSSRSFSFG
ncbi:hypothetical protein HX834_06160, partial [Marine Group I thaumarchaeote]|nr:hypothetical protein [Marine Group I thaumarchaeote]